MKHKEEKVIYIEYRDRIPHAAITVGKKGYMSQWDFEIFHGEKENIRYYHSGGGGHMSAIQPPILIDGAKGCSYWLCPCAAFLGEPKNITELKKAIRVTGYLGTSINPFHPKVSQETYSMDYCARCDHWSDEYCRTHQYEDENDDYTLKYIDDNSLVE